MLLEGFEERQQLLALVLVLLGLDLGHQGLGLFELATVGLVVLAVVSTALGGGFLDFCDQFGGFGLLLFEGEGVGHLERYSMTIGATRGGCFRPLDWSLCPFLVRYLLSC